MTAMIGDIFDIIGDLLPILIGIVIFSFAGPSARKKRLEEAQKKIEERKLNNKGDSTAYKKKAPESLYKKGKKSKIYQNKEDLQEQLVSLKKKVNKEEKKPIEPDLQKQEVASLLREKVQEGEVQVPDKSKAQNFGREELIKGIIFSEIISKPKALRR
ncbi:MAG: hypothetical protein GX219_02450 [Tissierellia bacterium]|mgnify:CR=1 FL=1|nr:hypothetical protein [Tissierellia bacterium]